MKRVIIGVILALATTQTAVADEATIYCQGMVCSTTPPDPSKFANFEIKNDKGEVVDVIYSHVDYAPTQTPASNSICSNCNVVRQPEFVPPVPKTETTTASIGTNNFIVQETTTVILDTKTATIDYSEIDWQTIDWAIFNWEEFLTWLTIYIENLLGVKP
jgi:hypothetical protein